MANYQSTHTGAQIDAGVDKANKALVKPDSAPQSTSLVAVDTTNTQTMLAIGDGLSVENGALKAAGGTKMYHHSVGIVTNDNTNIQIGVHSSQSEAFTIETFHNYFPGPSGVMTFGIYRPDATKTTARIINNIGVGEDINRISFSYLDANGNITFADKTVQVIDDIVMPL